MKYFIVGYMACGKTYRGKWMAKDLGIRFIDLDAYIVDRERRSIAEIFAAVQESGFRKLETRYLHEICELYDEIILSTGGGAACFNDNMDYMNSQGHTIFLNTDIDEIVVRLIRGKHKRPIVSNLTDEEIHEFVCKHIKERLPFYLQAKEVVTEKLV